MHTSMPELSTTLDIKPALPHGRRSRGIGLSSRVVFVLEDSGNYSERALMGLFSLGASLGTDAPASPWLSVLLCEWIES